MNLSEFDYDLPTELIAQFPSLDRAASRLLVVETSDLKHSSMAKFSDLLLEGDVLVFNDTKVVKARLTGKKLTGGRVEILLERSVGKDEALCQIKVSKSIPPGGFIWVVWLVSCWVVCVFVILLVGVFCIEGVPCMTLHGSARLRVVACECLRVRVSGLCL